MIKWYFRKLLPAFIWILIICKKLDAVAHGDAAIGTAVAPAATAPAAVDASNDEDVQVKQPSNSFCIFIIRSVCV